MRQVPTSSSSSCTPGSVAASSYDTASTGAAERERDGAGRARSGRHRPDRVRPLAPRSRRYDHRHDAARAAAELGRSVSVAHLALRREAGAGCVGAEAGRGHPHRRPPRGRRRAGRDCAGSRRGDRATSRTTVGSHERRLARRLVSRRRHADRRFHSRDAASRRGDAARVHRGLLARRVARHWSDHGGRARARCIRTTTRSAPCASRGKQLRDYLEFSARYFGTSGTSEPRGRSADARLQLRHRRRRRLHDRCLEAGRLTPNAAGGRRASRARRRTRSPSRSTTIDRRAAADTRCSRARRCCTSPRRTFASSSSTRCGDAGTLEPADVFTRNWELVPPAAVGAAYAAMRRDPFERASQHVGARCGRFPTRVRIIATNDFHGTLEPRVDARGIRRGGAGAGRRRHRAGETRVRVRAPSCCSTAATCSRERPRRTSCSAVPSSRSTTRSATPRPRSAITSSTGGRTRCARACAMLVMRFSAPTFSYADGRDVPWIRDDTLVEVRGVRVGIIGVATVQTPRTTLATNVRDLRFVDPVPVVDATGAVAPRARGPSRRRDRARRRVLRRPGRRPLLGRDRRPRARGRAARSMRS